MITLPIRYATVLVLMLAPFSASAASPAPTRPAAGEYTQKEFYRDSLAFNRAELVEVYKVKGKHDPKWDAAATAAMEMFAVFVSQTQTEEVTYPALYPGPRITNIQVGDATQKAIDAGCSDPIIFYARGMSLKNEGQTHEARTFFDKAVAALAGAPYSAYRQFKILDRSRTLTDDPAKRDAAWPAVERACIQMAKGPFINVAARREIGLSVYQALSSRGQWAYEDDLARLAKAGIDPWVLQYCTTELQIDLALTARGSGRNVTPEGTREFEDHLAKAKSAAEAAFKSHPELPEPATAMIRVGIDAGTLQEARKWFDRSIAAQPDSKAYISMFYDLMPSRGGSNQQILEIGKQAAATARFDTAIPFQFLCAASVILPDDAKIFTDADVKKTAGEILLKYMDQWKNEPRISDFFKTHYAALRVVANNSPVARKTLEALVDPPDPFVFSFYKISMSNSIEEIYLDTAVDQADVTKYRSAASAHNYKSAIAALDGVAAKDKPSGTEAQVIDSLKRSNQVMQDFRANKTIDFTDPDTRFFWTTDYSAVYKDGSMFNPGGDHLFAITSNWYLPDRHYELHIKFTLPDGPQGSGIVLRWGTGTGGKTWSLSYDPGGSTVFAGRPGADSTKNLQVDLKQENSIDIVYWDGTPNVSFNGRPVDYSHAVAKTVNGMSKENAIYFQANLQIRITQFTLKHLDAKP